MNKAAQSEQNQSLPAGSSFENLIEKLTAKDRVIEDRDDLIKQKSHVIDQQKRRILQLEDYLRLEKSRRYGPSIEVHPGQGELFNEAEQIVAEEQQAEKNPVKKAKLDAKGCPTNCHVNRFTSI
jgi:hypothetical protein